jgi:hypothetical protein
MRNSTTYTMLVTIAHDDGAAPSDDLLEVVAQRGLEEGVREFDGVRIAAVSAMTGDQLLTAHDYRRAASAKALHKAMRE